MKSLLILVLSIVLTSLSLSAQNWSLVMPNDTLVYEKQLWNKLQLYSLRVQNVQFSATDTTYYFNEIFPGNYFPNDSSNFCLNDNELPAAT